MNMFFKVFFVLLFCSFNTKAQFKINGNVKDALGKNLKDVTVSVNNSTTKGLIAYFITDEQGNYIITLPSMSNVFIRASYIGFNNEEKVISDKIFMYNFKLTEGEINLTEVKVKAQNMLTQNGDTLNYNVKQFSRNQDRTIGDVIRNLPGITVNPSGTISYNGRPINKFYIDGDDLLGEKYALASNTITLDAVEAVQVLENHQPVKMLENKVFSDDGALNIKLKESARLKVFGSGNISGGLPLYSGEARVNALAFKRKIKFINTYAFNNIGADLNTEVQTQNTNAPWAQSKDKDVTNLLGFTSLPNPLLPFKYYTNNISHLAAVNFLLPISKTKNIRFNLYWLPNKIGTDTKSTNTFYLQNDTIKQYENQINSLKSRALFFGSTYLNNSSKFYLQNRLSFESNLDNGTSNIENELTNFRQSLGRNNRTIQNEFLLKANKKQYLFEVSSNIKYSTNPENLSIGYGIYPWLLNNNINFRQADQYAKQHSITSNTIFSLSRQIKKFTTAIKAEYFLENINYQTGINLTQTDNSTTLPGDKFLNDLNWFQQRLKIGPSVDYRTNKMNLSIRLPVVLRDINYDDEILTKSISIDRFSFHPEVKANLELGRYSKLLVAARRETNIPTPQDLLFGGILHSYRVLSQNNQEVQFGAFNSISLSFSYRNPIKIIFFNTAIIYSKSYSPIISNTIFNSGMLLTKQEYFDNLSNRLLVLSNFSKYIFPIKATIKAGYSGSVLDYNQVQNNVVTKLKSISNNFSTSINSKPVWYFNTELSVNYLTSLTKNISLKNNITGVNKVISTVLQSTYNVNENFYLQAEVNHLYQSNNGNSNKFILFDAKLNYTIKKTKTDVGFKAVNIFNERRFIITDIDGLQVSSNDFWLRPLTLLLNVSFRF
ncbi:carboxypeptidase-like regulatory domain-containing protein [Pedobacter gandavensis]|uniref:carboxypeptidase-like regulatory domain-containing protein n=1 Tax=Pedobacter gandavensis TaxID=2679963 RepID=UPI002931E950|nr:carboxypeptidase-like regulatory domain-containing protein [Pedobacter gandavensis]